MTTDAETYYHFRITGTRLEVLSALQWAVVNTPAVAIAIQHGESLCHFKASDDMEASLRYGSQTDAAKFKLMFG